MVSLRHILALPAFSDFRVVSGFNGISRSISSTAFFDCVPDAQLPAERMEGSFVVTTLSAVRDDPAHAAACLRLLLHSGAAAIAIEDTYCRELPCGVKELSDELNLPVILFGTPGIGDVLYEVRSRIENASREDTEEILHLLLSEESVGAERMLRLAYRLNPYFRSHVVQCACVSGPKGAAPYRCPPTPLTGEDAALYARGDIRYALLPYRHGIFFILTAENPSALPDLFSEQLLQRLVPAEVFGDQCIGYSSTPAALDALQTPLREAFYANITSVLDDCPDNRVSYYKQLRLDKLLCSAAAISVTQELYDDMSRKLSASGGKNNAEDFITTLNTYVDCNGDVKATAITLHQHPNTIRYRLTKIQNAWQCRDILSFDATAKVFIRLQGILRMMEGL